jgi:hypothetical protein
VTEGLTVVAINGHYLTSTFGHAYLNLATLLTSVDLSAPPPLHLTVLSNTSETVRLCPTPTGGLGFHIRGSSPVVINGVDKGSAAADAGLVCGSCILRVGQQDVLRASHETVVTAIKGSLEDSKNAEGGAAVEIKVSRSNMEHMVQYEYETGDHTHLQVYERTIESPYAFSLPAELLKTLGSEAGGVANDLEHSGVSAGHVTKYISDLRNLAKAYNKTQRLLQGPRFPSYKPFGPTHSSTIEACPFNLHTSLMEVLSPSSSRPPPPPSTSSTDAEDSSSPVVGVDTTSYLISTMACPCVPHLLSKSDISSLEVCLRRYDTMQEIKNHVTGLKEAQKVLQGFVDDLGVCPAPEESPPPTESAGLLTVPSPPATNDLTPSSSPTLSHRARLSSFSNPLPSINLELEGLKRKVEGLMDSLESEVVTNIVSEVSDIINNKNPATMLKEFKDTIRGSLKHVKIAASVSPGKKLAGAMETLIHNATTYTQEVLLLISLSLAACNNLTLLQTHDKLFSQCLVALATGFSHQLLAATRGQLNPEPEYGVSNEDISSTWLQLVASKGVLFHIESLLSEGRELKLLQGLDFVARQLKSVSLHVVAMETTLEVKDPYPKVSVSGSRSALRLTFALQPHLFHSLPASLTSSRGVKVHPVLLNKGLLDISEDSEAYLLEKAVNTASLQTIRSYYRQLRSFRLGRSVHRQTSEEKALAISETAQPLHVLELLTQQLEVAVREPTRPGIGLLTVAAELATRMGAVRVCVCDTGVFRSGLACSLEQVMILVRSHQLPMRSMRLALDSIRKKGTFGELIGKNRVELSQSLPQKPPQLYRVPNSM